VLELDSDSSGCQRLHEVEKVAEIPCEPIKMFISALVEGATI
jgi:hypothetical protein